MRRTHVISARRTVAPRAGPDPRQQRPVLNGAAICLRAGWTGALGPAGLGAPSLCPHWLRALVSLSVPLAPTFRVLSEPVAVGGGPASLAVCSLGPTAPAWAPSRCGRRCGLHGGFSRRTRTQRCEPRAEGWGACWARGGPRRPPRAVWSPLRDSPGRTRGCPRGSPLSRGCPQPAALRSPGPGWAGHPSFTAQGARILQGDFYTERRP